MVDKKTERLLNDIQFARQVEDFIDAIKPHQTVADHLNRLMEQRSLKSLDVIHKADIDPGYGHEIFSGKKVSPSRNYLLRLAFALELDFKETQRLLAIGKQGTLYPKERRDAVIIYCLEKKYDVMAVDELLYECDEEPLNVGRF